MISWPMVTGIGTLLLAGVTAWMAIATWRMGSYTQKSVDLEQKALDASRDSARAAWAAIEHQKDILLPALHLDVGTAVAEVPMDGQGWRFVRDGRVTLTLQNQGAGPAFVCEITTRGEFDRSAVSALPVRRAILGAGQCMTDQLAASNLPEDGRMSSLSIWYTDVHHRAFRAQWVLQYAKRFRDVPDALAVRVVWRTHKAVDQLPDPASDVGPRPPFAPNDVRFVENGKPVPHDTQTITPVWFTEAARAVAQTVVLEGHSITGDRKLWVQDMAFWIATTPWPQFTVTVDGFPSIVLALEPSDGFVMAAAWPALLDPADYPAGYTGDLPPPRPRAVDQRSDHGRYGLVISPKAVDDVRTLYQAVFDAVQEALRTL